VLEIVDELVKEIKEEAK